MIGETVGNYRITGLLSEGGMGVVFRAEHVLIGRAAAIKVLLPALSSNREIVQRFFNEAKVTSSIRHPGIVEIFDFGFHPSGQAYLVMEFLHGDSLAGFLRQVGALDEASAGGLVRSIASALAAAHDCGVVHRDLKPDNIFLIPDPDVAGGRRPKILDFGIAKLAQAESPNSVKTRTGAVMGTPTYMAPEQCRGTGEIDLRADLYALGCILYELVCGRPPFVSDGTGEIIGMHLHVAPESPRRFAPALSPAMAALILRMLAKRPQDRPASAAALIAQLDELYGRPATLTSPGGRAVTPVRVATADLATRLATPVPPEAATVAGKPTTLGGTASEIRAFTAPRRRWPVAAAAAVVALLAGGLLAISMRGDGDGDGDGDEARPAAPALAPSAAKPGPVAAPVAEPEPVPAPEPAAAAVPEPVAEPAPVAKPVPAKARPVAKKPKAKPQPKKPPTPKVKPKVKPPADPLESEL